MAALIGISVKPKGDSGDYTCDVPVDLLSEDGVPPSEGDSVSYSVDGTVESVSGADAVVKIDAINGKPVSSDSGTEESPSEGEPSDETQQGEGPSGASPGPIGVTPRVPPPRVPGVLPGVAPVNPRATTAARNAAMGALLRKKAKANTLPLF